MEAGTFKEWDQAGGQPAYREGQGQVGDLLQAVVGGYHPRCVDGVNIPLLQGVGGQNIVVQLLHALDEDAVAARDGGVFGAHRFFHGVLHLKVPVQQIGPGVGGARVVI